MRGEIAALLVASACAGRSAHEPAPPVPATGSQTRSSGTLPAPRFEFVLSDLADTSSSSTDVDPMTLEQWHVDETGAGRIEVYAADADPDELIGELLPRDTAWISQSSEIDLVSGRLVAPSRSSAIAAIAKEAGIAARPERLPPGKAPSISVRLVREPLDVVARAISQHAGTNVMLAMHRRTAPLSIVARQAAPDALLTKVAQVVEGDLSLTARGWLLHERDGGEIARLATSGGPLVDVAFDQIKAGEAIALVSFVTDVPRRALRPCGGPTMSGQVAATRLGLVLAWLVADWPRAREQPCQLPLWRGEPPIVRAELVAIAWYSPTRAAALLRFDNGYAVIGAGQNGRARAAIGPTSIEVRERGRTVLEQSVEPTVKPDKPLYSTPPIVRPEYWRLAATVRDGASWRALLMYTTFEWRWVTDRDPLVRRIDRDRIILAPTGPGQPEIDLRLSHLPRDES